MPGNAAMYRLLQNYPPDRLRILLGNIQTGRPEARLLGPQYNSLQTARFPRLMTTRFSSHYAAWLYATTPWKAKLARKAIEEFRPQAVFTVAHTFGWLVADAVAQKYGLPLHLAVWDDHARQAGLPTWAKAWGERRFADVYRRASSRLCISPNMAELFEKRYGVVGTVLYPPRAADSIVAKTAPARLGNPTRQLVFGFAGSVNYPAYSRMLGTLSRILGERGHRFFVFGGLKPEVARDNGIDGPHVVVHPMLPIEQVLARIYEQVDVLFAPMAFEADFKHDMQISFPSKLTDYTAMGLPLLIWGPPYSSAARWARENPGVGVLVEQADPAMLEAAIDELAGSGEKRLAMGQRALEVGNRMFDHAAVTGLLQSVIAASVGRGIASAGQGGHDQ
jgi:glycosyltransferase involved in cell wall biosynthesis